MFVIDNEPRKSQVWLALQWANNASHCLLVCFLTYLYSKVFVQRRGLELCKHKHYFRDSIIHRVAAVGFKDAVYCSPFGRRAGNRYFHLSPTCQYFPFPTLYNRPYVGFISYRHTDAATKLLDRFFLYYYNDSTVVYYIIITFRLWLAYLRLPRN